MSEDPWRAPGREGSAGSYGPAPDDYPPSPSYAPSDAPTDPYASPGRPAGTDPYAAPGHHVAAKAPVRAHPYAAPGEHATAFAASDRHRDRVFSGAGYDTPAYRNDRLAVTAMVLGIVGVIVPGLCLLAIAFGHLALRRLRGSYEGGRGLAIAGLALGYGMTAIWLSIWILVLLAGSL